MNGCFLLPSKFGNSPQIIKREDTRSQPRTIIAIGKNGNAFWQIQGNYLVQPSCILSGMVSTKRLPRREIRGTSANHVGNKNEWFGIPTDSLKEKLIFKL